MKTPCSAAALAYFLLCVLCTLSASAQERDLFWIDGEEKAIYRGRLGDLSAEAILTPRLPLAMDARGDTLAWIDGVSGAILLQTSGRTDTLATGLGLSVWDITALTVDFARGDLYWFGPEDEERRRTILRTDMATGRPEALTPGLKTPYTPSLALDPRGERLYWTALSASGDSTQIVSAGVDGTDIRRIHTSASSISGLAVDGERHRLYWSDALLGLILQAELSGSNPDTLLSDPNSSPSAVSIDPDDGSIYWHDSQTQSIQRLGEDGTVETVLTDPPGASEAATIRVTRGRLLWLARHWTGLTSLFTAGSDGTAVEELVAGFIGPGGVAVDAEETALYWTDKGGKILRANLDGSEARTIRWGRCGIGSLTDIDVDALNDWIYWGESGDCGTGLHRMRRGGTQFKGYPMPYDASAIAVDPVSRVVYFQVSNPPAKIARLQGDSGRYEEVIRTSLTGLALDPAGNSLFWASCFDGRIRRSRLDGTNADDVADGLDCPFDIILDAERQEIYWSERGTGRILRSRTDGTDREILFSELTLPVGLAASFEDNAAGFTRDTLDWRRYYPLQIGNAWEYTVEDPYAPTSYRRSEIVGDTTIDGRRYFVQLQTTYGQDSVSTSGRRAYLRYNEATHSVVEYHSIAEGDVVYGFGCDLSVPFSARTPYPYTCPQADGLGTVLVYTKQTGSYLRVGSDSLYSRAEKMFCQGGPCDAYAHGIGTPDWMQEGGRASAALTYLRLDGREYGGTITASSSEKAAEEIPPSRASIEVAPNPTRGDAVIRIDVPRTAEYELAVYDVAGRRVALHRLLLVAGRPQETLWNELGNHLSAGVYFIRLSESGHLSTVASVVVYR